VLSYGLIVSKMLSQKRQLATDEIYHICYRAVGDSTIFNDGNDHYRGVFALYEFNNSDSVEIWKRRRDRIVEKIIEKKQQASPSSVGPSSGDLRHPPNLRYFNVDKRDKFVEILAFCFMPNHIHLLLKQIKDNGITRFMQKMGGGYANYFNRKYSLSS